MEPPIIQNLSKMHVCYNTESKLHRIHRQILGQVQGFCHIIWEKYPPNERETVVGAMNRLGSTITPDSLVNMERPVVNKTLLGYHVECNRRFCDTPKITRKKAAVKAVDADRELSENTQMESPKV